MGVDIRGYWRLDEDLLSCRTRAQLTEIAVESGLTSRLSQPMMWKVEQTPAG
jgi:hypothetical protein